jgi:plastocyanin
LAEFAAVCECGTVAPLLPFEDAMKTRALSVVVTALAIIITTYACGGDSSTPPTSPTPNPPSGPAPATQMVTITASGLSMQSIDLAVGGTVTFVNNDNRMHEMSSDPHPIHTDCPALNIGNLNPGESRASQALTAARSCGIHDHANPATANLKGTVTIR